MVVFPPLLAMYESHARILLVSYSQMCQNSFQKNLKRADNLPVLLL